jgi:glycosyltransferase involved in cell wall biosynthesis
VPSQGLATEVGQTYPLAQKKVLQIPNPIEVQRFARPADFDAAELRTDLGIAPTDRVIVFSALGDFDRKGLEPLLRALALLPDLPIKLLIVGGSPPEIKEYRGLCDRLHLTDRVVFTGFQADVRPYFWAADLFALPSKYETFSLVTFQAAAAGLPVLVTQLYGVEEFLQAGRNGWLIDQEPSSIAAAIRQAIHDPIRLAQVSQAAQIDAAQYDIAVFVERWRSLMQSFLG